MNTENQNQYTKTENKNQSNCCNTDSHDNDGDSHGDKTPRWKSQWPLIAAFAILLVMQVLYFGFHISFTPHNDPIIYGIALLLAGYNVFDLAWRKAKRFDFFNEFFLMSVAQPLVHLL